MYNGDARESVCVRGRKTEGCRKEAVSISVGSHILGFWGCFGCSGLSD